MTFSEQIADLKAKHDGREWVFKEAAPDVNAMIDTGVAFYFATKADGIQIVDAHNKLLRLLDLAALAGEMREDLNAFNGGSCKSPCSCHTCKLIACYDEISREGK